MMKVSIIIPVYNVAEYLPRCLDTVLNQTLRDIEIILATDGPKDCDAICAEYAKKDPRVKVILHPGSYGKAVNQGMKIATGEYVGIVEADDWCAPDMFQVLYRQAKEKDADVSVCSWYEISNVALNKYEYFNYMNRVVLEEDGTFNIKNNPQIIDRAAFPWKNLYKKEFIIKNQLKLREDKGGSYQDNVFYALVLSKASRMVGTSQPLYFYNVENENSSTNNGKTSVLYPIRRTQARQVLKENKMLDNPEVVEYFWRRTFVGLKIFLKKTQEKYRKEYCKSMRELLKKSEEDNLSFKYFSASQRKDFKLIRKYGFYIYSLREKVRKVLSYFRGGSILRVLINEYLFVIRILDTIIPKKKGWVLFYSSPDFADNSLALYRYLMENPLPGQTHFIFAYSNKWWKKNISKYQYLFPKTSKIKVSFVCTRSFSGFLKILLSKTFVINERLGRYTINYLSKNHLIINLWHGMPIKTIGFSEKGIDPKILQGYAFLGKNSYFFVTSDLFKNIMSCCFQAPPQKIYITGQPRNDCILNNDKKQILEKHLGLSKFRKVILYTPTYREFCRTNDDAHPAFKNIFYCDDYDEEEFYNWLKENDVLLLFKPHLFDEPFYKRSWGMINFEHPNVRYLDDLFFKQTNVTLYELFKYTDVLVSDFSSISVDYLMTGNPVIYLLSGAKDYSNERGFCLEDNYQICMPGYQAHNFKEFEAALHDALCADSRKPDRMKAMPLLHKYLDSNSCARVREIMEELTRKETKK